MINSQYSSTQPNRRWSPYLLYLLSLKKAPSTVITEQNTKTPHQPLTINQDIYVSGNEALNETKKDKTNVLPFVLLSAAGILTAILAILAKKGRISFKSIKNETDIFINKDNGTENANPNKIIQKPQDEKTSGKPEIQQTAKPELPETPPINHPATAEKPEVLPTEQPKKPIIKRRENLELDYPALIKKVTTKTKAFLTSSVWDSEPSAKYALENDKFYALYEGSVKDRLIKNLFVFDKKECTPLYRIQRIENAKSKAKVAIAFPDKKYYYAANRYCDTYDSQKYWSTITKNCAQNKTDKTFLSKGTLEEV